jgi:stage II sporulation protein D
MWRPARASNCVDAARPVLVGLAIASAGCARPAPRPSITAPATPAVDARVARVSLGAVPTAALSATAAWQLIAAEGHVIARGDSGARVSLTAVRGGLRVTEPGQPAREVSSPLSLAVATAHGAAVFNGRRYRGVLSVTAADSTVQVINRVDIESYLRGVVPRELGVRGAADRAALEAQAVAARSYAVTRLGNRSRTYDLSATTSDQVYGGVDAENALADAAVAATNGLVLAYDGRIVSAPYHSTCGGTTAEPTELWRSRAEPFLQRVSDRIPGTDRNYCDIAPRFRWERTWRADTLTAIVERYLRSYAQVPPGPIGDVRGVSAEGRTPSGRATAVVIETERGRYRLQGNDVRYVLRSPGGELLNSTYFSPEVIPGSDGRLARLTIRGFGYGHGVGMCQWGAIGRARAGQDFRTILRTYFPGTSVERAY